MYAKGKTQTTKALEDGVSEDKGENSISRVSAIQTQRRISGNSETTLHSLFGGCILAQPSQLWYSLLYAPFIHLARSTWCFRSSTRCIKMVSFSHSGTHEYKFLARWYSPFLSRLSWLRRRRVEIIRRATWVCVRSTSTKITHADRYTSIILRNVAAFMHLL